MLVSAASQSLRASSRIWIFAAGDDILSIVVVVFHKSYPDLIF